MKNLTTIIFIVLISALLYMLTVRGVWGDGKPNTPNIATATMPMESSHERAPYTSMLALAERNTFELGRDYADFSSPDVGISKGRFYSFFPPGVSVWILPFYKWGQQFNLGQVFAYGSITIFSVLTLVVIYLISREVLKLPISLSVFNALVYGFASTSWSYAITIYQHSISTFLIVFGFYATWKFTKHKYLGWIWGSIVWICYGLSIFVDYPNAALFLPVMFYFLVKSIKFVTTEHSYKVSIGLAIILTSVFFFGLVGLHGYYNQQNYGNWKIMSNVLPRYDRNSLKDKDADVSTIETQNKKSASFQVFSETSIINGLYELLFAKDKGIFYFSPIFVLSILGVLYSFKKFSIEKATLLAIAVVNIFLYASFGDPWGGWAFGPRYIIPAMAALSFFVGVFIDMFKYKFVAKVIAFILFIQSCAIALLGVITTNLVPPRVEAVYFKMKYGYEYTVDFLMRGQTGSFVYNNFFSQQIGLIDYYLIILGSICIIVWTFLFVPELFKKKEVVVHDQHIN